MVIKYKFTVFFNIYFLFIKKEKFKIYFIIKFEKDNLNLFDKLYSINLLFQLK